MKKIIIATLLAASLAGCTTFGTLERDVGNVVGVLTSAKVTPQQIIIAANAYDAIEATATQYLLFCKANPAVAQCLLATRKKVVADVRAARVFRAQLEPYILNGGAGPSGIYNSLVAAITTIKGDTPSVSQ